MTLKSLTFKVQSHTERFIMVFGARDIQRSLDDLRGVADDHIEIGTIFDQ